MADPPPTTSSRDTTEAEPHFVGNRLLDERALISLPVMVFQAMEWAEHEYWRARRELKVPPALSIEEHFRQTAAKITKRFEKVLEDNPKDGTSVVLRRDSWKNLIEVIRDGRFTARGNFWAAIQSIEQQLNPQA